MRDAVDKLLAVADSMVDDAGFELVVHHYGDGSGLKLMIQSRDLFETYAEVLYSRTRSDPQQILRELEAALIEAKRKVGES